MMRAARGRSILLHNSYLIFPIDALSDGEYLYVTEGDDEEGYGYKEHRVDQAIYLGYKVICKLSTTNLLKQ